MKSTCTNLSYKAIKESLSSDMPPRPAPVFEYRPEDLDLAIPSLSRINVCFRVDRNFRGGGRRLARSLAPSSCRKGLALLAHAEWQIKMKQNDFFNGVLGLGVHIKLTD